MERATSLLTDILDKRQNVKFTPEVIWILFMILATLPVVELERIFF